MVLHGTAWFFLLLTGLLVAHGQFGAAAIMGLCTGVLFGIIVMDAGED